MSKENSKDWSYYLTNPIEKPQPPLADRIKYLDHKRREAQREADHWAFLLSQAVARAEELENGTD